MPDLMSFQGEDRVRVFFSHSGIYYIWPDTKKTVQGLGALDLFLTHYVELSETAALADYVIATYDQLETPAMSQFIEMVGDIRPGYDWHEPYAFYGSAAVTPPDGADLMESCQIYCRVARKLGLSLDHVNFSIVGGVLDTHPIDLTREPTTDKIFEMMCAGGAMPLAEGRKHPHGALFEEARGVVKPRDPDCTARLQLAEAVMLGQFAQVGAEEPLARRKTRRDYPFRLICRGIPNVTNSAPRPAGILRTGYNPLWMQPDEIESLGLNGGDAVEFRSRHDAIAGYVEADQSLRRGVVAMSHGFGIKPDEQYAPRALRSVRHNVSCSSIS
jgi:anaerobic selenocysteine-containing dehydrogenase